MSTHPQVRRKHLSALIVVSIVATSIVVMYLVTRRARTGTWSAERVEPAVHYSDTKGLRLDVYRLRRGAVAFTVRAVSFDRDKAEARLVDLPSGLPGPMKEQLEAHQAQLVINGGFFDLNFAPVGQVRIDGRELSGYTSDPGVAGMVAIFRGGRVRVMRSNDPDWQASASALQTGPVLVLDGGTRAPLAKYVQSADRSGIAEGGDRVTVFVTTPVSLADLADALHDCPAAFGLDRVTFATALDGGPSSGMAVRLGEHEYVQEPRGRIRNAIVVRVEQR